MSSAAFPVVDATRVVTCPGCQVRTSEGQAHCPECRRPLSPGAADATPLRGLDLILRSRQRLTAVLRDEAQLPALTRQLLVLSVLGLLVHGLAVGFAAQWLPGGDAFSGEGHPLLWMPLACALAFLGALCICLPSFWFYTQLSGMDASFRLVTALALRGQATTSVLLLGVVPFYAAAVLAAVLKLTSAENVVRVGLVLPFVVGLFGVRDIYRAFSELASYLPHTHLRRGNFLRRMVLCWALVYSVVAPVALYRIGTALSSVL